MPLLDHFHPPLSGRRHWESFHAVWASSIASELNKLLLDDYFAEAQVHAGPRIEIDVATWENRSDPDTMINDSGGVATLTSPSVEIEVADLTFPATFPPEFGVHVYENSAGPTLVAAIELVSPGNKDREETRKAFTAKCATYIQNAIGLIVVDIVTNRNSRPFVELFEYVYPAAKPPKTQALTAVSYRPVRKEGIDSLEFRIRSLELNEPLPELPLALGGLGHINLDLEATYEDARERSRL